MSHETWTPWRNRIYRGNSADELPPAQRPWCWGAWLSAGMCQAGLLLSLVDLGEATTEPHRRQSQLCSAPRQDKRATEQNKEVKILLKILLDTPKDLPFGISEVRLVCLSKCLHRWVVGREKPQALDSLRSMATNGDREDGPPS